MSSGMPELGSKISLISKADIRYEGRLFTVDPQECTIALASVRSFGTEDRETQYPVAPQSQVYDYILFRGSDIKDIRVLNNVPSLPNDPAIMQMSVPPSLGGAPPGQFGGQFGHPVVGQPQYPQYHPMAGFPGAVHAQINKTSELSPQTSVDLGHQPQPITAPIGSGLVHHANQVKDQGSMMDLLSGGQQHRDSSRSGTPSVGGHRKSPTADQGTQVGPGTSGQQKDTRRPSNTAQKPHQQGNRNNRNNSNSRNNRQRYPSGSNSGPSQSGPAVSSQPQHSQQPIPHPNAHLNLPNQHQNQHHNQHQNQHHNQHQNQQDHFGGPQNYNRGGWRGRARSRGRGFVPRPNSKNTLKFDNDYDFEQANTEFEELRSQLAKTKISDEPKPEVKENGEVEKDKDKKDDSGNETGAGEPEVEEDQTITYDKNKSFFDNISCEAIERSKGRSQRTDWRTERKLNSETFGVASARRGAWRGRGGWRNHYNPQHLHQPWRSGRGGGGRGGRVGSNPRPAPPPQTTN